MFPLEMFAGYRTAGSIWRENRSSAVTPGHVEQAGMVGLCIDHSGLANWDSEEVVPGEVEGGVSRYWDFAPRNLGMAPVSIRDSGPAALHRL